MDVKVVNSTACVYGEYSVFQKPLKPVIFLPLGHDAIWGKNGCVSPLNIQFSELREPVQSKSTECSCFWSKNITFSSGIREQFVPLVRHIEARCCAAQLSFFTPALDFKLAIN